MAQLRAGIASMWNNLIKLYAPLWNDLTKTACSSIFLVDLVMAEMLEGAAAGRSRIHTTPLGMT